MCKPYAKTKSSLIQDYKLHPSIGHEKWTGIQSVQWDLVWAGTPLTGNWTHDSLRVSTPQNINWFKVYISLSLSCSGMYSNSGLMESTLGGGPEGSVSILLPIGQAGACRKSPNGAIRETLSHRLSRQVSVYPCTLLPSWYEELLADSDLLRVTLVSPVPALLVWQSGANESVLALSRNQCLWVHIHCLNVTLP